MVQRINAEWTKLSDDAFNRTEINFYNSIKVIDKEFGEGFAKNNPILISAFLQASSIEYAGTTIGACIQDLEEISKALDGIAVSIENK